MTLNLQDLILSWILTDLTANDDKWILNYWIDELTFSIMKPINCWGHSGHPVINGFEKSGRKKELQTPFCVSNPVGNIFFFFFFPMFLLKWKLHVTKRTATFRQQHFLLRSLKKTLPTEKNPHQILLVLSVISFCFEVHCSMNASLQTSVWTFIYLLFHSHMLEFKHLKTIERCNTYCALWKVSKADWITKKPFFFLNCLCFDISYPSHTNSAIMN